MTHRGDSTVRRFKAFISYSHADREFAERLHRRIEGYRLPASAAGQRDLRPCFIDRAELSAGSDLSQQVRSALAASESLIVVASPAARASRWVAKEIALFGALHPGAPILVALVRGEPAESFPDELGPAVDDVLAADFRKGRDGWRLGLLKLVSGIARIPLDRLVQRDAGVRLRRVIAVTVAVAILSMVLATLLVLALRAREEAEHQRTEAEGMVEFMLTDLRSRLKGVGSLKTMQTVNARAMAYYAGQDLDDLPDASLDRRARLLHAMGEDEMRLGNMAGALGKYRESHRFTGAILARNPRDPEAIFSHAQSEFYVGEAALRQSDTATTERHWRAYLALARRLAQVEPGTPRSLMELGYATGNMCDLGLRRRDAARALAWCRSSEAPMRDALRKDPGNVDNALALANRLGWHADALSELRRFDEALAYRDEEAGIVRRLLAADAGNTTLRERATWPLIGKCKVLADAGRHVQALAACRDADEQISALAREHPDDAGFAEQLMRVVWLEARSMRAMGGNSSALAERGKELHARLARTHGRAQMIRFDRFLDQISHGDAQ